MDRSSFKINMKPLSFEEKAPKTQRFLGVSLQGKGSVVGENLAHFPWIDPCEVGPLEPSPQARWRVQNSREKTSLPLDYPLASLTSLQTH